MFYGQWQSLAECNETYSNYSRGANCYLTNHVGAYHKHFQIKPQIKKHGGLIIGKDKGLHDSDYYLEVQVTNNALLTTTMLKKVILCSVCDTYIVLSFIFLFVLLYDFLNN